MLVFNETEVEKLVLNQADMSVRGIVFKSDFGASEAERKLESSLSLKRYEVLELDAFIQATERNTSELVKRFGFYF